MNVTFNRCEEILKTLPIGYYLGHAVSIKLDPKGGNTFIDLSTESITISYPTIAAACAKAREIPDLEQVIRGLLYHEISHALLTNRKIMDLSTWLNYRVILKVYFGIKINNAQALYLKDHVRDIINIFEDERIETLCSNYYMGVDFKKNVFLINDCNPLDLAKDSDPLKRFFAAVRFRVASNEILNMIWTTINYNRNISAAVATDHTIEKYLAQIMALFIKFLDNNANSTNANPNTAKSDNSKSDNSNGQPDNSKSDDSADSNNTLDSDTMQKLLDQAEKKSAGQGASHTTLKETFKKVTTNPDAVAIKDRLARIINIALNKNKNRSSSTYAYAGRIDPRATQSKDYRWFAKKAVNASGRRFDKIHFNLFCDNSGSFQPSCNKMNALLLAIKDYASQNPDFTVSIIHCGKGMEIKGDNDWALKCNTGSYLELNTKAIVDKLQVPNATVVNLVVFDGEMLAEDDDDRVVYKAFDKPNFIVVSDTDNRPHFVYAPSAKVTYLDDNYADAFTNVILEQLAKVLS